MTALFGFLTSLVDTLFSYSSAGVGFFRLFFAIYIRGVWFYVTHIVSNAFFLSIAFPVLRLVLIKVKAAYFIKIYSRPPQITHTASSCLSNFKQTYLVFVA